MIKEAIEQLKQVIRGLETEYSAYSLEIETKRLEQERLVGLAIQTEDKLIRLNQAKEILLDLYPEELPDQPPIVKKREGTPELTVVKSTKRKKV